MLESFAAGKLLQAFKEFSQVLLPERGLEKCIVTARFGKRQQNKFSVFYFLDFVLRDSKLRRIPKILLRIDQQHAGSDFAEFLRGVEVARRVVLIHEIVRIR